MHNLQSFLVDLVTVSIVLGIMIFVHEWGHFAAAKLCGVRVDVFSLGFGPRLFGIKRGDTDYRLSALPFGGYVRMAGDNPLEERTGA
jgi:regulator of sigma E protease